MSDQITCPNCQTQITISQALSVQLSVKLKEEMAKKQKEFEIQKKALDVERAQLEKQIEDKASQKAEVIKREYWQKAQLQAAKKIDLELKSMKEELDEKRKENEELNKKELAMIKEKRQLDEDRKKLELDVARKIEEERNILTEKIEKETSEKSRLKILELEKKNKDTQKALEEAQRKANQGSQQNQGEVLELDLEESLTKNFPQDQIEPIGKGVSGADIIQTVHSNNQGCGVILWEVKQTKNWTEGWVDKFKSDLRSQKANIPVLVTTALPKEIEGFGFYQNIWVCLPKFAVSLAVALRRNLISSAFERAAAVGKGEKAELLYSYVSSHEFRQRVEALVEVFQDMQGQIFKERTAFEKSWKQREAQMQRLFVNTAGMYGEMQGLVGSTMPEIKGLELNGQNQLNEKNKSENSLF